MRFLVSILLGLVFIPPCAGQEIGPRQSRNFDFDWTFKLGDAPGAAAERFNDAAWRKLDVPHDWSIEGKYDENNPGGATVAWLPTGVGWYRKSFDVTSEMLKKDVTIYFDGVFMDSTVWVNGHELGTFPYGYLSFNYDLSKYLHAGRNEISVRVNNSVQPASRWYTGSGIYGHVHLLMMPVNHIAMQSTFVRTQSIESDTAVIAVSAALALSPNAGKTAMRVAITALDSNGALIAQQELPTDAMPDQEHPVLLKISHPALWTPDTPTLYTLRVELKSNGETVDAEDTTFGIRTMTFSGTQGFLLNSREVKIRGVGDHLYGGPMGTAIPDQILEQRLQLLKAMGVNAIRTAHNPHTPIFYDMCDRMGIMVMDEIYDGWHQKAPNDYGARFYAAQWHSDVKSWVLRDRNHPSIFAWSIGNETGLEDVNHMTEYVHQFDPTRPTTGGRMTTGVDVAGFNGEGEVPGFLEKFHAQHPTTPMVLTEEPHTLQTRGYYRVRTWWRDWAHVDEFPEYGKNEIFFDGNQWYNSSYDNAIVRNNSRQSWLTTARTPWISGEFRWLGFDYIGEATYKGGGRFPIRAENFGIIDLAAIPKDDYYLYQAFWTKTPMVHLLPHWTHPGMDGVTIPIVAYSNQPEVELFLNGKSLGKKKPTPLSDFVWNVPYAPGELKAIAYDAHGQSTAMTEFQTAGDPAAIKLETRNDHLRSNRLDDAAVTFTVTDKNGVMVPWDMNRVDFSVTGPVRLLGYDNGDPIDVTPNQAPYRRAFYGMGRGFFQATDQDGPIEVTAGAILGQTSLNYERREPEMVAIAVARTSLRGPLQQATIEVRYTLDGREPTSNSPLYTAPLAIQNATRVKALVLRDGKPVLHLSTDFLRIDPVLVSDPRWATDSQIDPTTRH